MSDAVLELKVDVEVLREKIEHISQLSIKMDQIIEKIVTNQDKIVNQIYSDMEKRRQETVTDIKELHSRITNVDKNLSDKIELTELRIKEEIKSLRDCINKHNDEENDNLKKILQWKWMVVGGFIALAWVISNINLTNISKLFS